MEKRKKTKTRQGAMAYFFITFFLTLYTLAWAAPPTREITNLYTPSVYIPPTPIDVPDNIHPIIPSTIWTFQKERFEYSNVAIGEDGTIYFGSSNNFYALNPNGTQKWIFPAGSEVRAFPTIGEDGTIYFGTTGGTFFALDSNRNQKWMYQVSGPILSSAAIGEHGTIYFGHSFGLTALNPDGSRKWDFFVGDNISSPAIGPDGTIYFGSEDGYFYAINPDGSEKWSLFTGQIIQSSPAIGEDGTIYIGTLHGTLYAINPDGNIKWTTYLEGSGVYSSTVVGEDGTIYIGTNNSGFFAVNPDGSVKWNFQTIEPIISCPLVGSDGVIYVHSQFTLHAINSNGTEKWSMDIDGPSYSSPVMDSNGILYVAGNEIFYAISTGASGAANSTWPIFQRNKEHTGRIEQITTSTSGTQALTISSFTATPSSGIAPVDVYFQCTAQDTDGSIAEYKWDFDGDWNIDETTTGNSVHHTYNLPGTYNVTVIVEDTDGNQVSSSTTITISSSTTVPGNIKWTFETGYFVRSIPAVGEDGTIYFGSRDHKLYALNPDGTQKWEFSTGDEIHSSPAIGEDGTIYIGSTDNNLYAIDPHGTQKWIFQTGNSIFSSPAIAHDGSVYITSRDGNLYAINPDGTKKWEVHIGYLADSPPSIGEDGTIYVGTADPNNHLYAINPNGTQKWAFFVPACILSAPAIDEDGTIYFGTGNGILYALNPDGTEKWEVQTDNLIPSSPAIGENGIIYVGSTDGYIYAIDHNGIGEWSFSTGGGGEYEYPISSPAIGEDGAIYFSSADGKLFCLNPDGTERWVTQIGTSVFSSPTLASDGTIYIGTYYGQYANSLVAVYSGSNGPANTPWPMFHRDEKNTGRAGETTISQNQKPTISYYNAYPTSGDVPLSVYFECLANDDGNIVAYKWDFDGDGNIDSITTSYHVTYTYNSTGIYNATVIVEDNDNTLSDPSSLTVTVTGNDECSLDNIDFCTTQQQCEDAGGYWYNNGCHVHDENVVSLDDQVSNELTGDDVQNAFVQVGDVLFGGKNMKLETHFPQYDSNVDIYVGITVPNIGLLILQPDGTLGSPIVPYKANTTGPVDELVIEEFSVCNPITNNLIIPSGEYKVQSLVIPAGSGLNLSSEYMYTSYFFTISPGLCSQ